MPAAPKDSPLTYKQANDLRQTFRTADGAWAVDEYIDPDTFNSMMARLFVAIAPAQ